MSAILFHTRDHGEASIPGSERAYLRRLAQDVGIVPLLNLDPDEMEGRIRGASPFVPTKDRDPGWLPLWRERFHTWMRISHWNDHAAVLIDGEWQPTNELLLNTAIAAGGDVVKLAAWISGMCENHGRFEAEEQGWLEETIRDGLREGILRRQHPEGNRGRWEDVLDLIDRCGDDPIVMSYTVCTSFPESFVPIDEDDEPYPEWEGLSEGETWDKAYAQLAAQPWPVAIGRKLDQGYLSGRSAFDLQAELWAERLTSLEAAA